MTRIQYEVDQASRKDPLKLKKYYLKILQEPIPPRLSRLVERMKQAERAKQAAC